MQLPYPGPEFPDWRNTPSSSSTPPPRLWGQLPLNLFSSLGFWSNLIWNKGSEAEMATITKSGQAPTPAFGGLFYTWENWTSFFTSSSVQFSRSVIIPFHFFPKYTNFSCHALANLICFSLFHTHIWYHGSLYKLVINGYSKTTSIETLQRIPAQEGLCHASSIIWPQFFKLQILKFLFFNL